MGIDATFHGALQGEAKSRFLRQAAVVVFPSRVLPGGRTESAPVALLEAMAHGRPIVATAVGGVPEIVEHRRSGLLIAPDFDAAITQAVASLLARPAWAEALGVQARAVAARYSWSVLGPAHRACLERAADARGPMRTVAA
jgi:glycosyltransferase involved in cell wall biosynthesis